MDNKRIKVAITHGDTNGIGYELIFKAFNEPEMLEYCTLSYMARQKWQPTIARR